MILFEGLFGLSQTIHIQHILQIRFFVGFTILFDLFLRFFIVRKRKYVIFLPHIQCWGSGFPDPSYWTGDRIWPFLNFSLYSLLILIHFLWQVYEHYVEEVLAMCISALVKLYRNLSYFYWFSFRGRIRIHNTVYITQVYNCVLPIRW